MHIGMEVPVLHVPFRELHVFQYGWKKSGREATEEDRSQITKDGVGLVELEIYLTVKRGH